MPWRPKGGIEARGAVFTRAAVVSFVLDLVGCTEDRSLHRKRILEPSFGSGDFLLQIVGRLLSAWRASDISGAIVDELGNAIRAVELHRETFAATRAAVVKRIEQEGIAAHVAAESARLG